MTPQERLAAINDMITQFDASVSTTERALMDKLSETATNLLKNPTYLSIVLRDWKPEWVNLIQDLTTGILTIAELNLRYFAALDIDPTALTGANEDLLTAIGVTGAGAVIEGGYLATLLDDTSVGRQLISLVTDAKLRKLSESAVISKLRPLVRGKDGPGILGKLFGSLDTQPHVEADRVMQRSVSIRADLRAALYLGGKIDSTRPFCNVRNGKVFIVAEIEKFGTASDTYGGYADKANGYFSGKPRTNYDPFTQAGGYGCRHHWNYISNSEAMRRRDDLEEVKGVLRIKKG